MRITRVNFYGIRLVGINPENARKLLLTFRKPSPKRTTLPGLITVLGFLAAFVLTKLGG